MTARELMTAEERRGRQVHDDQVSSDGDRWERRGARQGDREAESEGWIIGSDKSSDEETEGDRMPTG